MKKLNEEQLWECMTNEVKEYMAIRYFKVTRCILTTEQIQYICKEELKEIYSEVNTNII